MARDRKCILCETVHASKQEMDEHIRSMLHHRELEKVKGRDCGHECRVCKVTVVSLTDYASHISSPSHKQNVEAAELKHSVNDLDEDYFDQALVELIEKRKEQIRKDKEAAAAKVAKEEEERKKKEEFQKRLQEAKEHYRRDGAWQQPSQTINGSNHQTSWYRGNSRYNAREQGARPWHNSNQGKSATWHAQEPPNLYKWSSAELSGGSLHNQDRSGNRQCDQAALFGNQPNRLPWLSNGGSSNGIYGRNNISQYPQRGRSSLLGEPPAHLTFPSFYTQALNQNKGIIQGVQQAERLQNGEGQTAEPDHNTNKSSKTFGSNPKLDKTCRWSPYPVSKGVESVPHKDTNPSNSLEKHPTVPKPQKQNKAPETSASNRQSRPEQKPVQSSSKQCVEEKGKHKTSPKAKPTERSSSGSRDSSCHKDERQDSTSSNPSNQKTKKPSPQKDWKTSSLLGGAQPSSKTSPSQVPAQSKSTTSKQSGVRSVAPTTIGPLKSRQERQLPEMLKKARQIVWEKRGSLDSSRNNRLEMALHIVEEQQQKDHQLSQIGVNKENSCKQNAAKLNLPDLVRPEKPQLQSSDSSQFLQSLQVSTSTMESSEPAASTREEEEDRSKLVKEIFPVAPEEAMQAVEAGQSSESDTSRSVEAQMALDGSNTSTLSKPDLPPVLKRDLTKHISSKSKPGSHEPNLNIARRVRNVSESKRSDSEKDSGLKPTVRQLISSSGSRRNVNWDQVYQEVRKKQDKGKGMPRFGIEMVQCEQEDHSQEEEEIPVLEGIQWEALMDVSASGSSRKRSLSESSIAPTITHSMFTSQASKETPLRETFKTEQHRSSISPNAKFTQEKKDTQCQQEVEQMLGQFEAKAQKQKQPDTLTSATVKALQRSDSVLGDSSGTEQCDAQGTGKRRRATGDVPSAETSSLEHNNKRRKVKSKKERSQIDQLLAVSLREDELSRTLQTVDTSLIQARAALEAAYMEVQRLMVVKQQMTGEMSTLRNKRIELLKGMQGSCMEEAPQIKLKEEKMDSVEAEVPHMPPSTAALPSVTYTAAAPSPSPPAHPASPPSSSHPFMPIVIKEEPQSPVHVSSEPDPVDIISHCAHSTTPALPGPPPPAASPPGASETLAEPSLNFRPSPERKPKLHQTNTDHHWENFEKVALPKETQWQLSGASGVLADPSLDFRPSPEENPELHQTNTDHRWENFGKVASPTHETQWELSGASETLADPSLNLQPSPERNPELHQPNTDHHWENFVEPADCKESLSAQVETMEKSIQATRNSLTPDSKSSIKLLSPSRRGSEVGGVVACAATHSFEQPSVPSTLSLPPSPGELRSGKRVRKLKKRKVLKKAQGTEQFESSDTEVDGEISKPRWLRPRRRPSGSSQVSTSTQPTDDREGDIIMEGVDDASRQLCPIARVRKPSKKMSELPPLAPTELTVNLDSEESMEVTTACMESHIDAQVLASPPAQIPHISRPELQQRLACNEVSSTSDMDICRSSESDMPFPTTLPNTVKTSSDASTDHEHSDNDLPTEGVFEGHQEAVNAMQIHNGLLYTCSGDRTVKAFDLVSHKCVGVFEGHSSKVSCLFVSAAPSLQHRLYTGSSDQIIRCYNLKTRELEQQFQMPDRVLCLHSRWKVLYAGLGNGTVVTFNLKTNKQMEVFECHGPRAVSCLASSQEGARRILLVGSYDKTITVRDAKNGLLLRTLDGHTKTVLCMKVVNDLVFSGSSDQCVYAHNIHTGEVVRVYKGHSHAVTVVAVLGQVMVTACLDKLVHVYDLWSHDQMQVYGGHKDMVMCMAIHKTMIYTGCYDGSVQAVKLNLMQNYRCWWHGCPLVFGVLEHLQEHLIHDHTNVNVQTLKCRWRNCEEFFCARNNSKQGMLMHMKKHLDEEFELEP